MKRLVQAAGGLLVAASVAFVVLAVSGAGSPTGGKLDVTLRAKENIISACYKVYALKDKPAGTWVAKTVFTNGTDGCVRDLRVRYRLDQYADWSSWSEHPEIVPGQTVVDLYYPILSQGCAALESRTPSELRIEYEYTDAAGERVADSLSKRLMMLSKREIIYSAIPVSEMRNTYHDGFTNAPLLAAWVTPQDKASSGLAATANEWAGGAGASYSNQECIDVMEAIYRVLQTIRVSYQSPTGTSLGSESFDPKLVQTLQYPRDTIRKRSGTCVELALLYASMCKSQGIKPYLVMLPGHCFPMARTPSGHFLPVEATCLGGGGERSEPFAKAVEAGQRKWAELQQTGQFILVDIDQCLDMGITPPQLEPLPDDILDRWGLTEMLDGGGDPPPPPPPPPGGIQPGPWVATVQGPAGQTQGPAQVQVQGDQVGIVFQLDYQVTDGNGAVHQCREVNQFVGRMQGNVLQAVCNQAQWTMDGQQMQPTLPINLVLNVGAGGRSAQGTATMPNGQSVNVTMTHN